MPPRACNPAHIAPLKALAHRAWPSAHAVLAGMRCPTPDKELDVKLTAGDRMSSPPRDMDTAIVISTPSQARRRPFYARNTYAYLCRGRAFAEQQRHVTHEAMTRGQSSARSFFGHSASLPLLRTDRSSSRRSTLRSGRPRVGRAAMQPNSFGGRLALFKMNWNEVRAGRAQRPDPV